MRDRFRGRCGYCGVHEEDVGATLTVDHFRPQTRGGDDDADNFVYCCHRCNEHKGSYWHEFDRPSVRLLHPLRDRLTEHTFEEESGHLVGLTSEGLFFIQRLRLNRPPLVAYRLKQRMRGAAEAELNAERRHVQQLLAQIDQLTAALERIDDEIQREGA